MERFPLYDWSCYFTSHRYRSSTFSKIKYPTLPEKSHDQGPQDHATRKGQATSSPTHVPLTSLVSPVRAVTWPRPSTEGFPPFTARHVPPPHIFIYIYDGLWPSEGAHNQQRLERQRERRSFLFLFFSLTFQEIYCLVHIFSRRREKKCSSKALRLRVLMSSTQRMRFIPCTTMRPPSLFMRTGMAPTNGLSSPRPSNMNSGPMPMSPS